MRLAAVQLLWPWRVKRMEVDGAHDRLVEVAIGEDDHRALAAEFERDRDEFLGGALGYDAADLDRAGEGHFLDLGVLHERAAASSGPKPDSIS